MKLLAFAAVIWIGFHCGDKTHQMKIDYLKINSRFKNLDQVKIDFDEQHLMTVAVGWNGSGKSNVIEALVSIFRNLDLGESPRFAYEIRYNLGDETDPAVPGRCVEVIADPSWGDTPTRQYRIRYTNEILRIPPDDTIWKNVPLSKVKRDKKGRSDYLPRYLFAYYSGPSDRLESYFKKHRTDFYRRLLRSELTLEGEIRPLFYAKPIHSQFVLLAFFLDDSNEQESKFLKEQLGIEGLDSVHFVLRRPAWGDKPTKRKELFWGADGVVREFLDRLFPHSIAPIKVTRNEDTSLTGSGVKNEFFHLFVPDIDSLRFVAGSLSSDEFFKMLESMLLSDIISEVRVRVKMANVEEALSFRELSEGEQQLLTILGLLKFTGGKDSLFLLDEPDTHLNPAWSVTYLRFLHEFIPNQHTSHMIMVSHNPLAVAELEKGQVQIMWRDSGANVHVTVPEDDPRGMGYAGILTSDMFGLGSTLDEYTTNLLRDRRAILEKEVLSESDKKRLAELNKKIEELGFSTAHWDEDYREYLVLRKKVYPQVFLEKQADTPEALKARKEKAEEIVRKILEKEAQENQERSQ